MKSLSTAEWLVLARFAMMGIGATTARDPRKARSNRETVDCVSGTPDW